MDIKDRVVDALECNGYRNDRKDTAHTLRGNLKVNKINRETGDVLETREVKNIITTAGAHYVRDNIGGNGGTSTTIKPMRWTAIGSGAAAGAFASADTGLHSETARSQNTFATTAAWGQFSNVTTFTNVAATIDESGIFNDPAAATGTMLAAQTFGAITLTTDDSLEVIWKVYFSEA